MGDRISAARENAGLSVKDLAQKLGVRVKTLTGWEGDEREPRANYLRTLSGVLGVSLIWLLTGEGHGVGGEDVGSDAAPGREVVLSEIRALKQSVAETARRLDRLERLMADA
ncbi:transcriptional regulator [Paracoccus tegillarcae]|uniref:Transcriptional regulator n=2 Tax=Paracoccus tegillarcae TaxID=1529068 RepID=A0A2K9F4X3_9RHOB|nr:transcriptional regulator [Paracoccus tegillarcae]